MRAVSQRIGESLTDTKQGPAKPQTLRNWANAHCASRRAESHLVRRGALPEISLVVEEHLFPPLRADEVVFRVFSRFRRCGRLTLACPCSERSNSNCTSREEASPSSQGDRIIHSCIRPVRITSVRAGKERARCGPLDSLGQGCVLADAPNYSRSSSEAQHRTDFTLLQSQTTERGRTTRDDPGREAPTVSVPHSRMAV